MAASIEAGGVEALNRLKSSDPPLYLSPSLDLSNASRHIFSSLSPFAPKSPFDNLLVDGFDAEQIWQQIVLQSQPLVSSLRRELKRFEKNPDEISKLFSGVGEKKSKGLEKEVRDFKDLEGVEDDELEGFDDDEDEVGDKDEKDEEEEEAEERGNGDGGVEDKFLKINELEEYLEEDEAREYGLKRKKIGGRKLLDEDEEDGEGGSDDEDAEDDEIRIALCFIF